jgi:hypothetical protein
MIYPIKTHGLVEEDGCTFCTTFYIYSFTQFQCIGLFDSLHLLGELPFGLELKINNNFALILLYLILVVNQRILSVKKMI